MPAPPELIHRHLTARVSVSLQDTPAVLVNGPRQCGKTTLVKQFAQGATSLTSDDPVLQDPSEGMTYLTLEDPAVLEAARTDPVGCCANLTRPSLTKCSALHSCFLR